MQCSKSLNPLYFFSQLGASPLPLDRSIVIFSLGSSGALSSFIISLYTSTSMHTSFPRGYIWRTSSLSILWHASATSTSVCETWSSGPWTDGTSSKLFGFYSLRRFSKWVFHLSTTSTVFISIFPSQSLVYLPQSHLFDPSSYAEPL